jgi:hypothetical protein
MMGRVLVEAMLGSWTVSTGIWMGMEGQGGWRMRFNRCFKGEQRVSSGFFGKKSYTKRGPPRQSGSLQHRDVKCKLALRLLGRFFVAFLFFVSQFIFPDRIARYGVFVMRINIGRL